MQKEKRFEIVYQEGGFMSAKTIYVDKETGVNYLFIVSGYAGGLTPLLDAEGNILTSSTVYIPVTTNVVLKHIIPVAEGVVSNG